MVQFSNSIKAAVANRCEAMESRDHFKNGASSKSRMSRENFLMIICIAMLSSFFVLSGCDTEDDDDYGASIPTSQFTVLNVPNVQNYSQLIIVEVRISADNDVLAIAPYSNNSFMLDLSNIVPPENSLQTVVSHSEYKDKGLKISKNDAKIQRFFVQAYQGNSLIGNVFMLNDENGNPVTIWYSDSDVTIRGNHKSDGETSVYSISFKKGWNFRYQTSHLYNTMPQSGRLRGNVFQP